MSEVFVVIVTEELLDKSVVSEVETFASRAGAEAYAESLGFVKVAGSFWTCEADYNLDLNIYAASVRD
jgi:hypothetical protein